MRSVVASALCALLLAAALPAGATLRTIEQAYELTRNQVQLPDGTTGSLVVRPCANCRPVVLQVTEATTWHSGSGRQPPVGQAAVLAAFRAMAMDPGTLIHVYYEPRSRKVTRVVLDAPTVATTP